LDKCVTDYFACLCLDACVTDTPTSSPVTNEDEATTEAAKIRWTVTIMEPGSVAIPFKSVMADAGKLKRRHQNIVIELYLYIIFDSNINHHHCCALFDTYHKHRQENNLSGSDAVDGSIGVDTIITRQ